MISAFHIASIAVRELLYEKVFYILLFFVVLSLGLSMLLGQLTYTDQAKLTLDFMLGGIQLSMVLFSIFMGVTLFHREITLGSISITLSKPVARWAFLIGKYLGQVIVQAGVIALMAMCTYVIASAYGPVSFIAIIQSVFLILLEVTVLTAITYFFAVNAGGIMATMATISLFLLGHLQTTISGHLQKSGELTLWGILRTFVPDLEIFNMKGMASYGISVGWGEISWIVLYALVCTVFFLLLATLTFSRKDILT